MDRVVFHEAVQMLLFDSDDEIDGDNAGVLSGVVEATMPGERWPTLQHSQVIAHVYIIALLHYSTKNATI